MKVMSLSWLPIWKLGAGQAEDLLKNLLKMLRKLSIFHQKMRGWRFCPLVFIPHCLNVVPKDINCLEIYAQAEWLPTALKKVVRQKSRVTSICWSCEEGRNVHGTVHHSCAEIMEAKEEMGCKSPQVAATTG